MKKITALIATLGMTCGLQFAHAEDLNVVTAGDQNMVDYINDYLGPLFEKQHPGVRVKAVGTGPADAGSQKIVERMTAQAKANVAKWDTDVAIVHEKFAGPLVQEGYLEKYKDKIATGKYATGSNTKMALGVNVDGYVMPMFNSQTAIAYNPDLVKNPPKTYADIAQFAKDHPKQFGYNGIKGGASGVSFVMGWMYAFSKTTPEQLINGPFNADEQKKWQPAFASLKAFNANATLTPGNAGTLDMLARGEIAMGPVWVDMFQSWKKEGRVPPNLKLFLPAPGMPGQPMHYVIPKKAAHAKLAEEFVALATSPEVQAHGIVERFNWYPGIDAQYLQSKLDPKIWQNLFVEITPADLKQYAKPFPIAPYNNAILEGYERFVAN